MAHMKQNNELNVITKTYDLILWSCNHTSKFPRNHRFVLGERIERNLYGLFETLIDAKYPLDPEFGAGLRPRRPQDRVRRESPTPPSPGPKVSHPREKNSWN